MEFNYNKSTASSEGIRRLNSISLEPVTIYESTFDEVTGRGVDAIRHINFNIDTQGFNVYDNILVRIYQTVIILHFVNKNSLRYEGNEFHHIKEYIEPLPDDEYGYFTDIVFGDLPRIKLQCPVETYPTHIENRYMFFDPDNERVINYFNVNPNKELICQLVDLNGVAAQLTADKIITETGKYSYNDYFFLAKWVDNDNISASGWLMYAPEVIRFLEDQVSSINYNNIGKLIMSIFGAPVGAHSADEYIENIPKYVSSELGVIKWYDSSTQGYLNPNGLVRAMEVGQEYNINLAQSIIENPEIEYVKHIKINAVE